jgi:hypothetical protein
MRFQALLLQQSMHFILFWLISATISNINIYTHPSKLKSYNLHVIIQECEKEKRVRERETN